jgi:hypothetical protein
LEQGEDPITRLGFGLTNYFDMMKILAMTMLVMSLISIPLFVVYSKNRVVMSNDEYGGLTLGSLG